MIIAECGQNHMGDMAVAEELINKAKECGCDLAKFQLYDSVKLYGKKQKQELTKKQAQSLFNIGNKIGIEVFFSVFDLERVKWCEEIGVKRYKIACTRKDPEVARAIAKTRKPIIESTFNVVVADVATRIFCVPKYPAKIEDYEPAFVWETGLSYHGISDHTRDIDCSIIALARGAEIIEKHFRLRDNPSSPDYPVSVTPKEMKEIVRFSKVVKCCI